MGKEDFQLYYYLLYSLTAFLGLILALNLDIKNLKSKKAGLFFSILIIVCFFILFGFRNEDVGTDTNVYIWQFDNYKLLEIDIDFLYSFLLIFLNKFTVGSSVFLLTLSGLYLFTLAWACLKIAKITNINVYFLIFSFVSMFFFQSFGINIMRQGIGLSFFLLGVSYYLEKKLLSVNMFIAFFVAVGFHFTSIIPCLFFISIILFKNVKLIYYYILYGIAIIVSIAKISLLDFLSFLSFLIVDERRSGYISGETDGLYTIGFKPQFVVFNTFFLFLFIWIMKYRRMEENNLTLLKYYLMMSSVFFLTFQISYSDRWGVMSWVVIPFLLAPIFIKEKNMKLASLSTVTLIAIFIFFNNYK